jgi:hypothetical protein
MMPVAQQASAAAVLQVFLSSTGRDYEAYRREVQDALLRKAQAACFLSEDWISGYAATVAECRKRLVHSNGFVLLLGHWYGSVPPEGTQSITHLEFTWALEKWKAEGKPRLAVMMPKQNSEADRVLRAAAAAILSSDRVDEARHAAVLEAFHREVTGSWRTVTPFEDVHELRENVIVTCLLWGPDNPLAAAQGRDLPAGLAPLPLQVTDEQLGSLGRRLQLDAVDNALANLAAQPDAPAAAFLVWGNEDGGQGAFVRRLAVTSLRKYRQTNRGGALPFGTNDVTKLVEWVAGALGLPNASARTPEALAESVAQVLARQPLGFSLGRAAAFVGGVKAFHDAFWAPFYLRLSALHSGKPFKHRLIAVVVDNSGEPSWRSVTRAADSEEPASSKLLELPELGALERRDVVSWLRDLGIAEGDRAGIADRALRGDRGGADPAPIRVAARLKSETLWPEEEPND